MDPPVNTVRAQSDLFTVQCYHWDWKTDGQPQNTVRAQIDLFNVQCCHSGSKADGLRWSTLSEHRVISSLFNVVIQTQRQMDPPVNMVRAQSYLFTVQCCHSVSKADGPPFNTVRAQSDLFTVQCCQWDSKPDGTPLVNTVRAQSDLFTVECCHSDSKADGPPGQHCQSTKCSLHNSMLSLRLKGRRSPQSTLSEHRVISSLFNVVIQTQRQRDAPGQHCQSTEWSLHCSMLSLRLKGRWTPQSPWSEHRVISSLFNVVIQTQRQMDPICAKHCQSTELSLHCSMLSFRIKGRWTPLFNTVRAQSDLFTVQCCHSESKADGPPKTLLEHRVISSLFNVVIQTQRQMELPVNTSRAHSDLFTVQCCHSESKADGPPCSTLSEHRVISSLFNVVIQTQRQMDPLCAKHCQSTEWSLHCSMLSLRIKGRWTPLVNIVRAQIDLFTVQCCHSDSKADGHPSQHCQTTEWSLHCSMLSFRLKGRWTLQSTLSEHRVISSLFNVVIQTQRQVDPPVNIIRAQLSLHCSMLSLRLKGRWTPLQHCQSTEWSLHCSMLPLRLKDRWTPQKTVRA